MARMLICTFPGTGHLNPGLPIARELVQRGHEVWWYTSRQFRSAVEASGAHFTPMQAAIDPADQSLAERFPALGKLSGLAGFRFALQHVFIDAIPGQVADLQRILGAFPADLLLVDTGFLGARIVHELGGPPWATYGITALTVSSRDTAPFGMGLPPGTGFLPRLRNRVLNALSDRVLFRDAQQQLRRVRQQLGVPPDGPPVLSSTLSPFLYLQSGSPAFEYPRSDLPPQVHFVGPLLPEPPRDVALPPWWGELGSGRPVVLVNQGTVATDPGDLILPALQALADEEVLVVVTTGGTSAAALARAWARQADTAARAAEIEPLLRMGRMGVYGPLPHVPVPYRPTVPAPTTPAPLPANARITPFVPFGALLPQVDVMVTNGGYGGVQFALAHGVPLVVAGMSEEKPEVAARVGWSGAGINLKTRRPTPWQIRAAVRTALTDPRYRRSAERIRDDYARHNAPEEAAELLEQLAASGQPVLRQTPRQPVAPRIEAILERLAPGAEPALGQPPQRPAAPRSHVLADVYERLQEGRD